MNTSMQSGLFDPKNKRPVILIGAGSVGSNIADMLARVGIDDITIYDGDDIESHNIPCSRFSQHDLTRYKVNAIARRLNFELGVIVKEHTERYTGQGHLRGCVIASVDTMAARKLIWDNVRMNPLVDIFLDTRVAEKFFTIFCVRPTNRDDIEHYQKYLYDDANTHKQACGRHGIITVASIVAAETVERLCAHLSCDTVKLHTEGIAGGERFFPQPSTT